MEKERIKKMLEKELKAVLISLEKWKEDDDEKAVMQFYGMAVECRDIMEMLNVYDSKMAQIYMDTMDRVYSTSYMF